MLMRHSYHNDLSGVKSTKVRGVHGRNLYLLPVTGSVPVAQWMASGISQSKQREWVSLGTRPVRNRRRLKFSGDEGEES